ncbi:Alpha/beta hydrolase family protein [Penicillium digitatum]|uniref:SWR1-complex protein 3 domain-containing protein n=3 Tax=Penicillium digitatum TaxID=36651 RepID=K9G8D9_PEND2|nr:hypothetical protein PDIP_87720 [Penicillium digitatum Pd1]EKV04374.1 hypothetical protein PDIP_87720 [Penicillium digitatum Pd1]EKV17252.1 hypothetical protein PDIG_16210 [Penicillium digitatum PHI26]QQK39823.1 Alpha/beta hydrolase family protein [Penicillium digitatum]
MAEKRKFPARDRRESAAKRRVSEITPQPHKKKAPTPHAPSPELVDAPLPTKVKDGDPLPIFRMRQPVSLSDNEYQSIAESAVLLASLERSKKKWLSDGILVRYYTKPKKTKREQIEKNNPSKDTMTKIGPCDVTIGPHFFDAMIYIVKDPSAPPALQYAPPQRPMVHYGHPNNFQQYRPYPSPSNQQRPAQYSPAVPSRPGYTGGHPSPQQARSLNQGNAPSPQGGQKPPQGQKGQPAKPSPDPVIQMLATRAAADPELKALMRVVASSQASQEQLRAFQAHIDELNAIIKSREQQEQRQQSSTGQPIAQPSTPTTQAQIRKQQGGVTKPVSLEKSPQTLQTPSKGSKQPPVKTEVQPQAPAQVPPSQVPKPPQSATESGNIKEEKSATEHNSSQPAPSEAERLVVPNQSVTPGAASSSVPASTSHQQIPVVNPTPSASAQQPGARPGLPYAPHQQPAYGSQPTIQSRPPQHGSAVPFPRPPTIPYISPLGSPPVNYKSVVFEFTSPLTPYGSSTSGHAGSGDRYLFPEYTILEWLPAENTVIASFLVVRKVAPNTPFPLETAAEAANSKNKGKVASKAKKGEIKPKTEKGKPTDSPAPTPQPGTPATATPQKQEPAEPAGLSTTGHPGTPASEVNLKEYWQPVTFRIHAPNAKILEPLARVVKPADEVRRYMNDIMDRAERAPDGYLAMRLPREAALESFEKDGTPASSSNVGSGTRSRLSRVQLAGEESEVENSAFEFEEDEENLKDFYDAPSGLPPLKA